jgi:hypothetical protein
MSGEMVDCMKKLQTENIQARRECLKGLARQNWVPLIAVFSVRHEDDPKMKDCPKLTSVEYRRWKANLYAHVQYRRFIEVRAAVAAGKRIAAWRCCLAMCRYLPWSRKYLIHGLALTTLGQGVYEFLARTRDAVFRRNSEVC